METRGTVVRMFPEMGRLYGFMQVGGEKDDVFFHLNDGKSVSLINGRLYLQGYAPRIPKVGDVLQFARKHDWYRGGRLTTDLWAFADDYQAVKSLVSAAHLYRVTRYWTYRDGSRSKRVTVLWEGWNIQDTYLSNVFPHRSPLVVEQATLAGTIQRQHTGFEVLENGVWTCLEADPRDQLPSVCLKDPEWKLQAEEKVLSLARSADNSGLEQWNAELVELGIEMDFRNHPDFAALTIDEVLLLVVSVIRERMNT